MITPEKEEELKQELDTLVDQLDIELSSQRIRQIRARIEEIRAILNPPKSRIKYGFLKD